MRMYVGDHDSPRTTAPIPQRAIVPAIEVHDPAVEAVRIEIVIENELRNAGAPVDALSEQESAALALTMVTALTEREDQLLPERARTVELRRWRWTVRHSRGS